MHRATPVQPMRETDWKSALFKAVLITLVVMGLLAGVTVPAMLNGQASAGVIPCVILQMAMTTVCVGGWFVLFLCFDKHLGDDDGQSH